MVRDDKVDILVDLTGHTANKKLGMMACQSAPVQAFMKHTDCKRYYSVLSPGNPEMLKAIVTFGLNALNGRTQANGSNLYTGSWDGNNTLDFMNYTASKGYKIDSWDFGNELSGSGIGARVDAKQYGEDLITLKQIINQVYANSSLGMPRILAPGGFFDAKWFAQMLQTAGQDVLDTVLTIRLIDRSAVDPNLASHIVDGFNLDNTVGIYKDLQITLRDYAPWASAWIGESGGAYNSGGRVASHTFVNSFWYLDQLGMTSTFGHKVFCRQTLIGGNYALLNTTTFIPNPDYYSALLWHRLMGPNVLETTHDANSTDLRAYSHCSKGQPGVTLLLINLSNTTIFNITGLSASALVYDGPQDDNSILEGFIDGGYAIWLEARLEKV